MRASKRGASLKKAKEPRFGSMILAGNAARSNLRGDDTRRREEEHALRESEEFFRSITNTVPVMIWMSGLDKLCTYFNQAKLNFTGRSLDSILGNGWTECVHPEDLGRCRDISTKAFDLRDPFAMEFRFRRHDGEYRWILSSGVPRFNAGGSFVGYIGSAIDVTERKLAEESLCRVSQRLIEAQEEERVGIARELHHYIDSLTVLAIDLDRLGQNPPESVARARQDVGKARQQVKDIVNDIQTLSHQLYSLKLEYLGLTAAAASFCKELSARQKVKVDFQCDGVANELPKEISLCLYRVLQEALQNATKHSGSETFRVSLNLVSDEIHLIVRDWGIGFDPKEAMKGPGIGLTHIQEHLKLVDGKLLIESRTNHGATIHARVPLKT
jgi:PAS domain S-box-containing protein